MANIYRDKILWIMDLLTNDEVSSNKELTEHFVKEGSITKAFAKELVKHRTFGDLRKDQAMQNFIFENIHRLEKTSKKQ